METLEKLIFWLLQSIRGGAESLESLDDELDAMLDLARSPQSGTTTTDGTEQFIYDEVDPHLHPWHYAGSTIDLSNMGAGNTIIIRIYEIIEAGGGWLLKSIDAVNTYTGIQTAQPAKQLDGFYNVYGVRISIELTVGANIDVPYQHFDAMRSH